MPAEHILLRQVIDAREVIGSLIRVHSLQKPDSDRPVVPGDVPLRVLSLCQVVLESEFGDFLDHVIMRVQCKHHHAVGTVGQFFWADCRVFALFIA